MGNNAYAYDANGNLTDDGAKTYLYDIENRLVEMSAKVNPSGCASGSALIQAKLRYDPMGRLHEVENFVCGIAQGPTRFLYDGDALVAEYDGANAMLARYIHGPAAGADDPLIAYNGAGVTSAHRRNLYADARGSIVLSTDSAGGAAQINTYDEYGVPGSTNTGRFQYTGQIWLSELGMNYYKARMYSPTLGRFMQTDPIGYEDNVNLYGYVGNDPINGIDFTGMCDTGSRIGGSGGGTSTCKTLDGFQTPSTYGTNSGTKMVDSQRISQTDEGGNSNTDLMIETAQGFERRAMQKTVDSGFTREFGVTSAFDPDSNEWVVSLFQGPIGDNPLQMGIAEGQRLIYASHTHRGLGTSGWSTLVSNARNDHSIFVHGRKPVVTGPSPGEEGDIGFARRVSAIHPDARFGVWYQEHRFSAPFSWQYSVFGNR